MSLAMRPSAYILLKTDKKFPTMAGVSMVLNKYSRIGSFSACASSFL